MKTVSRVYPFFLLASSIITCSTLAFAKEPQIKFKTPDTLTVCSYSEFQPVSYGNGEGYEPDMLRGIAKLWNVKIKFIPEKTFADIWLLPSKKGSPCDVSSGGITPDYTVRKGAVFSKPTTSFSQSLLVRKKDYDSQRITSYRSFINSNMKIGVVPKTTGEKYAHIRAKDIGLPISTFVQYNSESELIPALISGKIDAIARGELGNEYQASKNKELITIEKKSFDESFTFAVDNTNQELLEQLNQAIEKVTKYNKITYVDWLNSPDVFMKPVK